MDIPISDSPFQDDDFTRVEVQLEPRHVALLKALAAYQETSFDQAMRYLINAGAQHALAPKTKQKANGGGESVFDRFRSIAHRIKKLQEKKESTEPREMHEVLERMLNQYRKTEKSSSRSDASPSSDERSRSEGDLSGPPSMFEIANKINQGGQRKTAPSPRTSSA